MKKRRIFVAVTIIAIGVMMLPVNGSDKISKDAAVPTAEKKTVAQAQKNEPEATKTTVTGKYTVIGKKAVRTDKNGLKKDALWMCPVCGAPAEPDSLCSHCGEPYTRLYGYGFVRCWKTADGIEWELETAPECGCTPDEVCDFCRDKLNHGWKSSGEVEYYEYSDFLKKKGLPQYEAVHMKDAEEEKEDVQDENGESVQQPTGSEEKANGEVGELENVSSSNSNDNGGGTADNVDNVTENSDNLQEE